MAHLGWKRTAPFTFIWAIENYRKPPYLKLQSPSFIVDSIDKTKWRLVLHVNQHSVFCYIKRQIDKSVLKSMGINFELAVLAADGTPVNEQKYVVFHFNPHSKIVKLVENNVLSERTEEFLPNDTLTIRCRIRRKDVCNFAADLCFARTQLRDEQIYFIWAVEKISSILPGHKRNHSFPTSVNCGFVMTLSFYLDQDDNMFHLEIHTFGGKYCGIKSKISVLDTEGKKDNFVEVGCQLHLNEQTVSFPPFIEKKELMNTKNICLQNDILILNCEIDIFAGINWSRIEYCLQSTTTEVYVHRKPENNYIIGENSVSSSGDRFVKKGPVVDCHVIPENCIIDENFVSCKDTCALKKILKCIREERMLSDVSLRTGNQLFPAHKNILSARSSTFEAMFRYSLDQVNSTAGLRNLDGNTLRHMLLYIYTDSLDNLGWKDILDLFCISDDYELNDLKKRCSALLKANLSKSNIFDVLSHAYEHQDESLILASKNFILEDKTSFGNAEGENVFKKCRKRISKGYN